MKIYGRVCRHRSTQWLLVTDGGIGMRWAGNLSASEHAHLWQ